MKAIQAWVLWNEQRSQYLGDFDTPKIFSSRDKAVGATPFDSDSTLNRWKPVFVRIIPAEKRSRRS